MKAETAKAIDLALKALLQIAWRDQGGIWSRTCLWCGGYERTPAMDQDYAGKAGHRTTCARQNAIEALESARTRDAVARADERVTG